MTRWWKTLIFTILFSLALFQWSSSQGYQGSIGLGLSLNNPAYTAFVRESGSNTEFSSSLKEFTQYANSRVSSVEYQANLATAIGLEGENFDDKSPFFNVITSSGGGFISISLETETEQEAKDFVENAAIEFSKMIEKERFNNQ